MRRSLDGYLHPVLTDSARLPQTLFRSVSTLSLFLFPAVFIYFFFLKLFLGWHMLWSFHGFGFDDLVFLSFFLLKIAFRIRNPARGSIHDLAFDFDPVLCQFRSPSSWYARFEVLVSHLKCLIFGVWFSGTVAVADCEVAFLVADSSLSSSFSESIVDIFEAGLESGPFLLWPWSSLYVSKAALSN